MSKIVERTLDFLELFAEQRRPLSLSDISRLLQIPVSSCHDVLQAMQARGYIYELAPRGGYYPTLRFHHLSTMIAEHDPVVQRADILLRALRDTLDESVLLAKVNGLQATYLLAFEPSHPLRFQVKVGDSVRSLYATSGGRALLGSLDERARDAYLRTVKLTPMTALTLRTKTALRKDIELGNARGWFINRGESQDGVTTLSARFVWSGSVYIITIASPSARIEPRLDEAVGLLRNVCALLEMRQDAAA
jgi:DNA-binding IclR family transcriptional regulator